MMMLPLTPYKRYVRTTKRGDFVEDMMRLNKGCEDVPDGFADEITNMWLEEVVSSGRRLELPHNLGNVQVLEHQYEGEDVAHLSQFGNLDYSVIFRRHPMHKRMRVFISDTINAKARAAKKAGKIFLNDYMAGDALIRCKQ